jgi:hypothetical protein
MLSSKQTQEETIVEPPNLEYLKAYAVFAKVLNLCGVAECIKSLERDAEMEGTLRMNGETDFASLFRSKLAIIA